MTETNPEPAATSPGRAAYEAHRTVIAASLGLDLNGSDDFDGPPAAWEALAPSGHAAWDAAAQAAAAAGTATFHDGCTAVIAGLERDRDDTRDQLEGLRDRIDSLARGLDIAARSTAPSKKSEIESGCASALRGLLRIDGESGEETRLRLERERPRFVTCDHSPAELGVTVDGTDLRALVAEMCDALDHGGPYWVERWRERAGLEG